MLLPCTVWLTKGEGKEYLGKMKYEKSSKLLIPKELLVIGILLEVSCSIYLSYWCIGVDYDAYR